MSIIDDSLGTFQVIKVGASYDETSILPRDMNCDTEIFLENSTQFRIVQTKHNNRVRTSSSIWNYFVFAEKINETDAERDSTSDDRILCYLCFSKGIIQLYKKSTASSNLWKHLCKKHNIKIPKEKIICIKGNFKFDNGIEQFLDSGSLSQNTSFIEEDVPDIFTESSSLESNAIFDNKFNSMNDPNQKVDYTESFKDIGMQLIHEVHKRPLLYEHQTTNKGSLKTKRENLWMEIYIAMDKVIEIDRLQKMWKNIRDRFKRIRNAEKQGMEQTQKYKYYNQLKFLEEETYNQVKCELLNDIDLPIKKVRFDEFLHDTINTVSSSNYEDVNETETEENNLIETYTKDDNIKQNSISCGGDNNTAQLSTVTPNTCCNVHLDEFDYFGKFIAFKLRSSPQNKLTELQSKIIQIFD